MLADFGLVTDAEWLDYDNDGRLDLLIVGEWLAPTLLRNTENGFVDASADAGLNGFTGWWYSLHCFDADQDGDLDFVAGNLGLNSRNIAREDAPFEVYAKDFDDNGTFDIVLGYHNKGTLFPLRGRSCSSEQIPAVGEKFPTYNAFGGASLQDVWRIARWRAAL